jgi:pimeloyl-ACP methyl ester carboxylesterase
MKSFCPTCNVPTICQSFKASTSLIRVNNNFNKKIEFSVRHNWRLFPMLFQFVCIICFVGVINAAAIQQKKSSADCEWITFEQPLSHFTPGVIGKTFQQRICINKEYWKPNSNLPVLFYTGNESPVNEYVDNTGLMWDLAKELNALIIFAEHRYFGESIPEINGVENCMAYLTSSEALADYALFLNTIKNDNTGKWGVGNVPIIAFGGSYGGMLSSWMRIKYPSLITGSISASAPVLGFPMDNCQLDASSRPVTYATSNEAGSSKYCSENLKKSYVLLYDINKYNWGKQLLSKHMNLCTPLSNNNDINILFEYLQSPLFDLAEGSYPFETDYITYALTSSHSPLPAWAMNVMCNDIGNDNYNIKIENKINTSNTDVEFTVTVKAKDNDNDNDNNNDNEVKIDVNWDKTTNNNYTEDILLKTRSLDLLHDVAQSIQVRTVVLCVVPCTYYCCSYLVLYHDMSYYDMTFLLTFFDCHKFHITHTPHSLTHSLTHSPTHPLIVVLILKGLV